MLFRRKKCVLYTRLRQLVTYYTYATQAKTKTVYDYTKFKYSYLTNPSLNVHRLLSSRPEHKLPPLMQIYSPSRYFSFLNFMKTIFIIRTAIDQNFDIFEFRKGVCQVSLCMSIIFTSTILAININLCIKYKCDYKHFLGNYSNI